MATSQRPPQQNAYILGVGMTAFLKPRQIRQYPELGYEAGIKALLDAHLTYDDIDLGIACFGYGGSTAGQRVFYQFGMTGIPIYNVRNACATGSSGLYMARQAVRSGERQCVLVVGFEQMAAGALVSEDARPSPVERSVAMMESTRGVSGSPQNAQFFANAGREYMERYGATEEDLAEIARISHENSGRNPYAQFRERYSRQEILESPVVHAPLTKLQCSPTSDGAAAAVVVSDGFLRSQTPHLRSQAILMAGQTLTTDDPSLFSGSSIDLVGFGMSKRAAREALREASVGPKDVDVCELHDCFSTNELILLDALGFCDEGKAHEMVRRGDIAMGGAGPIINPSGGLISKGHPLGATGLAQCCELTWQLRGWSNNRFVRNASVALQHNLGLGGCCVVTVYKRADGQRNREMTDKEVIESSAFDYNPATEFRYVTQQECDQARSRRCRSEYALGDIQTKIQARM